MEIQIAGSFSRDVIDSLREDLEDAQVAIHSGFAGERLLKIVGTFSEAKIERIRTFLIRLIGGNQIGKIVIKRGSIELMNIPAKNLEDAARVAECLMDSLRQERKS